MLYHVHQLVTNFTCQLFSAEYVVICGFISLSAQHSCPLQLEMRLMRLMRVKFGGQKTKTMKFKKKKELKGTAELIIK